MLPEYTDAVDVADKIQHLKKIECCRSDPKTLIIDVRDGDFFDGHIKGAKQVPSGKFKDPGEIDKVIDEIPEGTETVVVHCQLSQIRGPKCAGKLSERLSEKWDGRSGEQPAVKVLRLGYDGFFDQVYGSSPDLFEGVKK